MECGLGQVLGFTIEGINFILGLNEYRIFEVVSQHFLSNFVLYRLVYVVAEPTAFEACYDDLKKVP